MLQREYRRIDVSLFLFVACLALFQTESLDAKEPKRPPTGPLITIYAPHPKQLELALDEVEVDWRKDPSAKGLAPGKSAVAITGTKPVESEDVRAMFAVSGATSPADLLTTAIALKAANPGAEVHLILYEPGLPRSPAARRLLTREVALLLEPGEDLGSVLAGLPVGQLREVKGVPGGYVLEAADPIAALDLADALRQRPGVRSAYPLLKRAHTTR